MRLISSKTILSYLLCSATCFSVCAETVVQTQTPNQLILKNAEVKKESEGLDKGFEDDLELEQNTSEDGNSPPVLYDPNMNYGKGAPPPKEPRINTQRRSLWVFASSLILATAGMLISASNSGKDAPKSTH